MSADGHRTDTGHFGCNIIRAVAARDVGLNIVASYTSDIEVLDNARTLRVCLLHGGAPLSWADVVELWQNDAAFREFYISILADAPFQAYFWETPPITSTTINRDFEFVLVDSDHLADVEADQHAFASHFLSAESAQTVLEFPNLGGDATLVVPSPQGPATAYSDIRSFAKLAPEAQQHQLWRRVGGAIIRHLGSEPVWVSTSGLGVYWLHIRIDTRPKYYTFDPYRA